MKEFQGYSDKLIKSKQNTIHRSNDTVRIKVNIDSQCRKGKIRCFFAHFKKIEKFLISFIKSSRAKISLVLFREYSTTVTVVMISLLIIAGNINRNVDKNFLFGFYGKNKISTEEKVRQRLQKYSNTDYNLMSAPLVIASSAEDIKPIALREDQLKKNEIQYQVLTATEPDAKELLEQGSDVAVYKVKAGDTVGSIAKEFNVTVNTILWANDIDDVTKIKPGDKIFILPVTGVKHVVKRNDTIEKIAKKYKAKKEEIISFNGLPADGRLKVGEEIIIPGGEIEAPRRTPSTVLARRNYYGTVTDTVPSGKRKPSIIDRNPKSKGSHKFPYGQCTWYVAQHKYVPWGGNAGTWLYHARAYGAKTGKTPKVGAIIVTSESWYGHVGIVTKVKNGKVYIKEMNYKGWAVVSSRAIPINSRVIKGYIY